MVPGQREGLREGAYRKNLTMYKIMHKSVWLHKLAKHPKNYLVLSISVEKLGAEDTYRE